MPSRLSVSGSPVDSGGPLIVRRRAIGSLRAVDRIRSSGGWERQRRVLASGTDCFDSSAESFSRVAALSQQHDLTVLPASGQ